MSRLFLAVLLLLPAACAPRPGQTPDGAQPTVSSVPAGSEADRFIRGLDKLIAGQATGLKKIAAGPASGPWRERAAALLARQERLAKQAHRIGLLEQRLQTCDSGSKALKERNAKLKQDLQELKRILVEMETRD
ncbi:MAG TPA: hypothetical protein VKA48_04975 [Gammaproteobacteria bacterium]|nr:hypothetical protein [Gammaproteobacteria bacterium]